MSWTISEVCVCDFRLSLHVLSPSCVCVCAHCPMCLCPVCFRTIFMHFLSGHFYARTRFPLDVNGCHFRIRLFDFRYVSFARRLIETGSTAGRPLITPSSSSSSSTLAQFAFALIAQLSCSNNYSLLGESFSRSNWNGEGGINLHKVDNFIRVATAANTALICCITQFANLPTPQASLLLLFC